ncbi:MAG: 16S rRNA (uracil(1498)-N(3))-methyltransferase [Syntrophaceae bacterium]|nr:16S rRNA (uracil(1498)-N(3))-methyltransferase [Syntrophaceae bacterium]
MNLILLHPDDLLSASRARLTGRRLKHVLEVHRANPGDQLAVGLLGGKIGMGTVTLIDSTVLEMDVRMDRDPPAALALTVVLALPRPKVLRRVLHSLSVMGVKRIVLMNSARVEKSYWQTPFLEQEAIDRQLVLGLEQARDTMLPEVILKPLFKPFVEDELPEIIRGTLALAAHPGGGAPIPRQVSGPITLAVGPEGGFVPFEIDMLVSKGFTAVSLGERVLNVETAVPALISRIF